MSNLLKSF